MTAWLLLAYLILGILLYILKTDLLFKVFLENSIVKLVYFCLVKENI